MKLLILLAFLAGCGGRDVAAPDVAAPLAPSLDFYAACERPAIFVLRVDEISVGMYTYNVAAGSIGLPVVVPVSPGPHSASYWEFDAEARLVGYGGSGVTVTGPTRVDMACAP